jgi:hypothetical protein
MATTSRESDFDRVKRWGKAFLTAEEAGIGQDQSRSDEAARPIGDAGNVTAGRMRFNPPPGWPPAPAGWVAPPGWQPDPSWPEPPPGWPLWVADRPVISLKAKDSLLAMAGGTAVFLGSLLPWISVNSADVTYTPGARGSSVLLGLVLLALGFALRVAPRRGRLVAGIAALCLSSLAGLLYVIFIVAGLHGVPVQDAFGDTATATWTPDIGIMLATAGCAAAFVAAILSFHPRQD